MSFFASNRRFYSSPSPSATNLLQPTSLVCHSRLFSHSVLTSHSHPTALAGVRRLHILYQTRCPPTLSKISNPTANLEYPSFRFHQTPPPGAPTSRLILRNQTTTFTIPTHGVIENLTEASTYSPTGDSLMSVVFSFSVLGSWPYCMVTPLIRPCSFR